MTFAFQLDVRLFKKSTHFEMSKFTKISTQNVGKHLPLAGRKLSGGDADSVLLLLVELMLVLDEVIVVVVLVVLVVALVDVRDARPFAPAFRSLL